MSVEFTNPFKFNLENVDLRMEVLESCPSNTSSTGEHHQTDYTDICYYRGEDLMWRKYNECFSDLQQSNSKNNQVH